jgi:hypothetical protein
MGEAPPAQTCPAPEGKLRCCNPAYCALRIPESALSSFSAV